LMWWVFLILCALLGGGTAAEAQSVPGPTINTAPQCSSQPCTIWTPAQWVGAWQAKIDTSGGSAAGLNLTDGQLKLNGVNGLSVTTGNPYQQGVFAGPRAGLYLLTHSTTINFGVVGVGPGALESESNGTSEAVGVGYAAGQYATSAYGITAIGEHADGFDNASYIWAGGNDAMRDTIGNNASTATGAQSQRDGTGNENTSTGAFALMGNAGSIGIAGIPTPGDVRHIAFTTANANTTGLPYTINYTVLSGDTPATMAVNVAAAISAGLTVGYLLPDGNNILFEAAVTNYVTAFTPNFASPAVVAMHFPGGPAVGWAISMAVTCTGTCVDTWTVNPAFSGTDNVAEGREALSGAALTTGSLNQAIGTRALANLSGSSSSVLCDGYQCGFAAVSGIGSVIRGNLAAAAASVLTNDVIEGQAAANGLTTGIDETIIGAQNGNGGCITTGNGNMELGMGSCVPSPTSGWQLDIQDGAIIGVGNNAGGGGGGGGQIGIEMKTAPTATFEIGDYGGAATYGEHQAYQQTTLPAITGCTGCTLDATGSDTAGTVTEGTTQTGFVLTFHVAYATAPHCVLSSPTGGGISSYSVLAASLTVVNPSLTAEEITYVCFQ
jgi:hypothetical protein